MGATRIALIVIGLSLALGPRIVHADTVILRSGQRHDDVKTRPSGASHIIYLRDGRSFRVPNGSIRSLRPGPTSWSQPAPAAGRRRPRPRTILPVYAEPPSPALSSSGEALPPWIKSAILPGWGQYAEDRKWSGIAYAAATALALQYYWGQRQAHSAAEADYNDPLPTGAIAAQTLNGSLSIVQAASINLVYLGAREQEVFRLERRVNNTVLALALIWTWNMLDIFSQGRPWSGELLSQQRDAPEATVVAEVGLDFVGVRILLRP